MSKPHNPMASPEKAPAVSFNDSIRAVAKWGAARKAEELLAMAAKNPQFSERGVFRARVGFNLGLIKQALGRADVARTHFERAREVAGAQEAPAIVAKIDAEIASLS